jgi:hypothetical protein
MTRFQKVASALRGGSERDEQDLDADDRAAAERVSADRTAAEAQAGAPESSPPWVTREDEAAMAGSPISREPAQKRDYWDDPGSAAGHEDDAAAVTSPDTHPATEPDIFGTGRRTGEETAEMSAARAEGQPGAATIADVPAADATGSTGRHAAATASADAVATPGCGPARRPGSSVTLAISPTGTWSRTRSSSPHSGRRSSSGSSTTREAR